MHFAPQTGRNVICDVLAGERGPSCSNIKQVPDLKLIYVRFISDSSCARASRSNVEDSSISFQVEERSTRKRQYENSVSYTEVKRRAFSVPSPKKSVMHKPVPPKGISVTQMLKLGKVVESPEVYPPCCEMPFRLSLLSDWASCCKPLPPHQDQTSQRALDHVEQEDHAPDVICFA